jgi:cell division inhibitor SepF
MGFADVWNKTLVYFGIAEEDEEWDEEGYLANEELELDDRTAVIRPAPRLRGVESVPASVRVHLVLPRSFNDAQQIADKFKDGVPVILNLQGADQELSKRLIDFASGLTYALNGGMQRVADKVFLLTPQNVEVSAEERARLLERGGFFNQA